MLNVLSLATSFGFSGTIMEEYDYEAAATTVKIEDVANDRTNREILRKLKENDPTFKKLGVERSSHQGNRYSPENARDFGWLGYYIGNNTHLRELHFYSNPFHNNNIDIEPFFRGLNNNRSIQKIEFFRVDLMGGEIFQSLHAFFENNSNLSDLMVHECDFGAECAHQLSLTLGACNKSLKSFWLSQIQIGEEQLAEIIEALNAHPQLEELRLICSGIGTNECMALANVLRHTITELRTLNLYNNAIDDEGMDILVGGLLTNANLNALTLSYNNITGRGCQSLVSLLEQPNSSLENLYLNNNIIGDEGALIFADALARNSKLMTLSLSNAGITAKGWSCFSKVLCDNSSINNTFLSNHTLLSLCFSSASLPADVTSSLALNRSNDDKRQVAMEKILKHHRHFDMQPFFEWDLKVLPIAIDWFDQARSIENTDETVIDKQKLGAIYQFIHAMPEVFEPAPGVGDKRKRII